MGYFFFSGEYDEFCFLCLKILINHMYDETLASRLYVLRTKIACEMTNTRNENQKTTNENKKTTHRKTQNKKSEDENKNMTNRPPVPVRNTKNLT